MSVKALFVFAVLIGVLFVGCGRTTDISSQRHEHSSAGLFYVATNGNDAWTGSLTAPNRQRNDGPFHSIDRALRAVVELKREQGGKWKQPVFIFVRGGIHWLRETIVLSSEHSGTIETPLTISSYKDEKPLLSAGCRIGDWKAVNVGGKELWAASVPETRDGRWFFRELWVNGERRTRARNPNKGYSFITRLPDATPNWESGHSRFNANAGDVEEWASATNGEAIAMTRWVESRMPITGIDRSQNLVTSSKRSVFQLQPGDPFYVEHIFEVLDQPGEWYLDRSAGLLYYMPLSGETLAGFEAIAPRLEQCVRFEGEPEKDKYVEHVTLNGLTFAHNEWYYPTNFGSEERHISTTPDPEIYGSAQAAFVVPGAMKAIGARNCLFENCTWANIGSYGLQLGRGCQSNRVSRCEFRDLAAGGIRIGETIERANTLEQVHHNEVLDCRILDGGKMFHSGEGIWIGQSPGNRIAHNEIGDFYYTGISIGWTWGYESSFASNNLVEFNHVHHIGRKSNGDGPILSDMGGIYTLGQQPGTVIRNNLWHDIYGLRYGGWAIYFDEGSSYITAENNVAFGTTHGGFHQHYGKENIVQNNVFALGRENQLQRTRAEEHNSFTFERNIVYFNEGKLFEGDWTGGKFVQDYNLYFDSRTNPQLNFPGGFVQWQKSGYDVHSSIADPKFASTNLSAFLLQKDSPAFAIGFRAIDVEKVGPRR